MEPEWTWPYFQENYTGPYLSDGKFQSSVANGKAKPRSKLDRLSREHDTKYAQARNDFDRRKADLDYYRATRKMSFFPRLAGNLVLYVNDPTQLFNAMAGWGEIDMGNSSGRERAERLRRENKQVDGKDLNPLSNNSTVGPSAPIYYQPKVDKPQDKDTFGVETTNNNVASANASVGSSNSTHTTVVYYPTFDNSLIFKKRKKKKNKNVRIC